MNEANINRSIAALKRALIYRYGDEVELYLYGSVARNEYRFDSDIDILVLFPGEVDTDLMEEIFGLAYEVGLEQDVVFGIVVQSKEFWNSEFAAVMPFHQNVQRESLRI
ncbi:MAG: nucleotidyltransferase domain-containing protein [Acidobacteria bacterium]|jgi:predicted nucleotidyltransferase|nr:nucleotidyltransferase domain-containing protein [Acidobacteriota bacterium]